MPANLAVQVPEWEGPAGATSGGHPMRTQMTDPGQQPVPHPGEGNQCDCDKCGASCQCDNCACLDCTCGRCRH
jgi:hypothetical protein